MNFNTPKIVYEIPSEDELRQIYPNVALRVLNKVFLRSYIRTLCAEAQNWRCAYCTREMTVIESPQPPKTNVTLEHIVCEAYGGPTSYNNCVAACERCNGKRGNKPLGLCYKGYQFKDR